ncbi:MAG: hypothetical protein JW922_07980, partial [Paludibacteraceae bacterium]|nr:hypothetical protein [Paludibacteraceae bacterium]
FYHIAIKANVPLVMGKIDYKKKEAGLAKVIYPTGDFDKDFREIVDFLSGVTGKNPENYNPRPANIEY